MTQHTAWLALASLAALARGAQDPPAPVPAPQIERLTEWPKLEKDAAAAVDLDIERLRKARVEEMGAAADAALTAIGAGVVPKLVAVLGKERDAEARERVVAVLEKLTAAEHTRLLAPYFADKSREVRSWSLHRCAQFPDAGVRAQSEAALSAAKAAAAKDPKAEGVDDEIYAAALCTTSAGSHAALETIAKYALDQWGKRGVEIRTSLAAVRDEESTAFAAKFAQDKDRKRIVAGLNLLAGCGTKTAIPIVRPLLDSTDNSIRVASINAMRGIVDGELPIANLSAFDAIELAMKWKARTH